MNKLVKYAPLLKYASMKTSDLTVDVVKDITGTLGIEVDVDDGMVKGLIDLAAANDVQSMADLLGRADLIERFRSAMTPVDRTGDTELLICPHCGGYVNPSQGA